MPPDDLFGASEITTSAPASPTAITNAEGQLGVRLPDDYRALLLRSNGLQGFVAPESFYLILYPIEFVAKHQYDPNLVPGMVVIGSDGGGEAFGFVPQDDGGVLYGRVPFIGDGLASMDRLATTFEGFIERLRANDFAWEPRSMEHTVARADLEAISASEDFPVASASLVDTWVAKGAGVEFVEPVLRFMEEHPNVEYGVPGALVHFVERFHRRGYENALLESIARHPTWTSTWMLNRLINGAQDVDARSRYLRALADVPGHPLADEATAQQAREFLGSH